VSRTRPRSIAADYPREARIARNARTRVLPAGAVPADSNTRAACLAVLALSTCDAANRILAIRDAWVREGRHADARALDVAAVALGLSYSVACRDLGPEGDAAPGALA
jgi:hypothetical protein